MSWKIRLVVYAPLAFAVVGLTLAVLTASGHAAMYCPTGTCKR